MNAQQKTELENKILETLAKAEKIFHKKFNFPKIEYKDMGKTAGRAWMFWNKVTFAKPK